jgi:hypothetical protein
VRQVGRREHRQPSGRGKPGLVVELLDIRAAAA